MPIRKNKKRIDPRYFLDETTRRDEIEEGIEATEEALSPAIAAAMKAKGMSTDGAKVASNQNQDAVSAGKMYMQYTKMIAKAEDELKAAIENNFGPQEVFKLKQKMFQKITALLK